MSERRSGHKLGPVSLAPGVTRGHALAYLWAAFVSIGIFTYATALQPYLLEVNIGVPQEQRGVVSGNLQFWQEIITLLMVGLFGAWSDRIGRRVVYVVGFLITGLAYAAFPFADDTGQLPGAGQVPVLGALFRNKNKISQKRELVVLIKPTIVDSANSWNRDLLDATRRIEQLDPRTLERR